LRRESVRARTLLVSAPVREAEASGALHAKRAVRTHGDALHIEGAADLLCVPLDDLCARRAAQQRARVSARSAHAWRDERKRNMWLACARASCAPVRATPAP
jgi:hypothetical protein